MSLVVSDFGWTKLADEEGNLHTPACITWPYRCPEIELLQEPYTKSCDVWSLGVLARELFTGSRFHDMERYAKKHLTTLEHAALAGEISNFPTKLSSSRLFSPLRPHVQLIRMKDQSRLPWPVRRKQEEVVLKSLRVIPEERENMKSFANALLQIRLKLSTKRLRCKTRPLFITPLPNICAQNHTTPAKVVAARGKGAQKRTASVPVECADSPLKRRRVEVVPLKKRLAAQNTLDAPVLVNTSGATLCKCKGECRVLGVHFGPERKCANIVLQDTNFCKRCSCTHAECSNARMKCDKCYEHWPHSPAFADDALRACFIHSDHRHM
jgi:hypothetical protein